jgi:general L-amino acid transport system permease protein
MQLSERLRDLLYQATLVALIGAIGGYAGWNLMHNLESRAITIGFSYLGHEAGFDISERLINFDPSDSYGRAFMVGLLNTLFVSALAIVCATLLGLTIGIARLSPNWLLAKLAGLYIESIRNVPLILQLLLWYGIATDLLPPVDQAITFGNIFISQRGLMLPWPLPHPGWWAGLAGLALAALFSWVWASLSLHLQMKSGRKLPILWPSLAAFALFPLAGWFLFGAPTEWSIPIPAGFDFDGGKNISPEFAALLFGLSIYAAAFIAEIVRGGILAVPHGQIEASQALGLSRGQQLRLVVLPQALRVIVPPLTSQYLNLIKNSSLAVAIGYPDLVSVSTTTLNQTGQAIEAISLMMLVYLGLSLATSGLMNWYNERVKLVER